MPNTNDDCNLPKLVEDVKTERALLFGMGVERERADYHIRLWAIIASMALIVGGITLAVVLVRYFR